MASKPNGTNSLQSSNGQVATNNGNAIHGNGPQAPNTDAPVVAVIGAGVAGLRASEVLLEKGYNVVLLEARDRIGGRVFTSDHLGKPVDLGPNWIHGTTNNPIVPLSELSGSSLHEFGHNCPVFDPKGQLLDQEEADELQHMLWEAVEEANEYSKEHQNSIPADQSLYDYSIQKAEEQFGPGPSAPTELETLPNGDVNGAVPWTPRRTDSGRIRWKGQEERRKEIWLQMMHMWGTFIGSSVMKQSLKFFFLEEPVEGPNLFVANTYKSMIETLSKPARKAGIIQLSTPISSISSTAHMVSGEPRVLIKTQSGASFSVHATIVTAPLGCLKKKSINFDPPLPERIQSAISSLSYGTLEKVYVNFPKPFWTGESTPSFYTFLTPEYAPDTNPEKWHMCCFSLAHLPAPHDQATLLFYTFGSTSAYLTSTFPSYKTDEGLKKYKEFFKPYFSRLRGYQADSPDCVPQKVFATNWSNDEYAGFGSYSNFQVGLKDGEEDISVLREGMADKAIWFAGEHTAPILGLGSVSGAYWSGEGAAGRVIQHFEKSNGSTTAHAPVTAEAPNGTVMNGGMKGEVVVN
ncbi:hypothetical protein EDC01DRAFT_88262 [Geopyxis carbonaria]|nr:hypothetical protein EDC01DRAFT_88262 [Geopyxis carbonaria]